MPRGSIASPERSVERLENSTVRCKNASIDALRALQRDGAGRPRVTRKQEILPLPLGEVARSAGEGASPGRGGWREAPGGVAS